MADTLAFEGIGSLAGKIRQGAVSPVALTEELLARIDALDPRLHAFIALTRERALGASARRRERAPRAAMTWVRCTAFPTRRRTSTTWPGCRRRRAPACSRTTWPPPTAPPCAGCRRRAWCSWARHTRCSSPSAASASTTTMAPRIIRGTRCPRAGRIEQRLGCGGGGRPRADGAWHRHGRVGPNPAALCGTVGLKTTVGRISRAGVYPLSFTLDSVGPLTRSVEDAALVYQALQGPDFDDETTVGVPHSEVLGDLRRGVRGLRIAFGETVFFDGVDAEVDKAVRQAGQVFRGLGAHVDSMAVPEVAEAMADQRRALVVAAEALAVNGHLLDKHLAVLDPIVTSRMAAARTFPASDYFAVMRQWAALRRRVVRTLADVDALIVPATMIPARPVSVIDATPESYSEHNSKYLRNTVARQYAGPLRGEPAVRVQQRGLADRPDDLRQAVRRGDGAARGVGLRAGDGLEGTTPRPHLGRRRRPIRAHLLRWRPRRTLNVERLRLACCLRAPLRPLDAYGKYASPAAFGRRLAAGPFSASGAPDGCRRRATLSLLLAPWAARST